MRGVPPCRCARGPLSAGWLRGRGGASDLERLVCGSLGGEPIEEPGAWSSIGRLGRYVAARFFPIDAAWGRWLAHAAGPSLGEFEHKPHDLVEADRGGVALVIYKRGGTAKVVPVIVGDAAPSPALVRACEHAARLRHRRKVSMFVPEDVGALPGYDRELIADGYSIHGAIAMWSRRLS